MRSAFLFALLSFSLAASALSVSFGHSQLSLCPCQSFKVPLKITDASSTPKIFAFSPQGLQTVVLTRNDESPVGASLLIGASCGALPGNYLLTAEAVDSRSKAFTEGIVTVVDCISISLQLLRIEKTCSYQEYYLQATNNGIERQDVLLESNLNPSSFRASQEQFSLRPTEKQIFFLRVYPPTIREQTIFTVSLKSKDASASLDLPFASPLCEQGGATITSPIEQLSPIETRFAAASLPATGFFSGATGLINDIYRFLTSLPKYFSGKRFSPLAAALIVLALLAVGFLYFRSKLEQEKASEQKEQEKKEKLKEA